VYLGLGLRLGGLGLSGFDADAAAYFDRAGVTDATAKAQINAFVKGLKSLGVWNSSVVWPMRSAQNKGSGTTLYTLGGLGTVGQYDGTLVNGPTWNPDGIYFDGSNDRVTLPAGAFGTGNTATTIISFLKNETNSSRGIFLSQGNNNVGTDAFSLASPDSTATTDSVGIAFTDQAIATKTLSWKSLLMGNTTLGFYGKNGGTVASFSLANSLNKSGNNCAFGSFGDPAGVAPFNGYAGLVIRINATPTTQLNSDIYNLYVSTLGSNRDLDADAYILKAGISSATAQTQINDFVVGIKSLGIWNNMVCWPLRSSQNKGSGSTVYSLGGLGTYNGTMGGTSLPTWGANGLTNSSDGFVRTAVPWVTTHSGLEVYSQTSTAGLQAPFQFGDALAGAANGRRTNFRTDTTLFLYNGSYTSYSFGPSSLNAFKMAGYGVISGTSILGYNDGSTSTVSSSPVSIAGGTATNNFLFLACGGGGAGDVESQFLVGTAAFVSAFNIQLSSGQNSSLYSLYKTTLGTGLGLP